MINSYGLPPNDLAKIRLRDDKCVYCHEPYTKENPASIEHLYPPGNDPKWVAICCRSCNSSHKMPLRVWFKSTYCQDPKRKITEDTVAEPIKKFLNSGLKEYDQLWLDGKEHDFLLRDQWVPAHEMGFNELLNRSALSDADQKSFDKIVQRILKHEFAKWYPERDKDISRYDPYEYTIKEITVLRRKRQS